MITGSANHGLYIIFFVTAMSFSLYRLIVATTSSPLFRLGYILALALFKIEILRVAAVCFHCRLTKTTCRATPFWTWPGLILGTSISVSTRPSWQQNYIAMSCGNNARIEGLDVTLYDPTDCMWTDLNEWLDVSA